MASARAPAPPLPMPSFPDRLSSRMKMEGEVGRQELWPNPSDGPSSGGGEASGSVKRVTKIATSVAPKLQFFTSATWALPLAKHGTAGRGLQAGVGVGGGLWSKSSASILRRLD